MPKKNSPNKERSRTVTPDLKEDTTKYGEFISSFHNWIPSEAQKERARHLEDEIDDQSR